MKTVGFSYLLMVVLLSSCMWGKPGAKSSGYITDTAAYRYQTIKQRLPGCNGKSDSVCTIVDISYPLFNDQPALNDSLMHRMLHLFIVGEKADTSLQQLSKQFMDNYQSDLSTGKIYYKLQLKVKVLRQDSSLLTLQLYGYNYQGGAHGSTKTTFINWNTKSKRKVILNDLLIKDAERPFYVIAEKIFRREENLGDAASLVPDYFFKNGRFSLNNNFLIMPRGINFLYNQYEIKPYAAGQTDLFIPYTQIQSLLQPNTVVSQYIK